MIYLTLIVYQDGSIGYRVWSYDAGEAPGVSQRGIINLLDRPAIEVWPNV